MNPKPIPDMIQIVTPHGTARVYTAQAKRSGFWFNHPTLGRIWVEVFTHETKKEPKS